MCNLALLTCGKRGIPTPIGNPTGTEQYIVCLHPHHQTEHWQEHQHQMKLLPHFDHVF
jgi:hypothetical protein